MHSTQDKARYLRQSVQLTGLGTPIFQTCIDNIQQIHMIFAHHMTEGAMEDLELSTFQDAPCITTTARYLTSRREDPHSPAVRIPRSIDPKGILAGTSGDYFYGQDNEVLYYSMISMFSAKPTRCVEYYLLYIIHATRSNTDQTSGSLQQSPWCSKWATLWRLK